jgi:hypothetical protein
MANKASFTPDEWTKVLQTGKPELVWPSSPALLCSRSVHPIT